MKDMKLSRVWVLCGLLLASALLLCAFGFAEEEDSAAMPAFGIQIHPYGGGNDAIDAITLFQRDETCYLFLPSDAREAEMRIWFPEDRAVSLDGHWVQSGGPCPELYAEGNHTLEIEGAEPAVVCVKTLRSRNLPAVYIRTESGSMTFVNGDKENKEVGCLRIREAGEIVNDAAMKHIKGRGNATWFNSKKPYNIKLQGKIDILGMGQAKKWTLLANAFDPTLLRNALCWKLSEAWGLRYTLDYRHIDLYANGEYLGNYIICESVEVGENRVNVRDLQTSNESLNGDLNQYSPAGSNGGEEVPEGSEAGSSKWLDMPYSPGNITGGYLLEWDTEERYDKEKCGFVTQNGQCVVIKSPEDASKAEVDYISSFVGEAVEALYAEDGYNQKGRYYTEYFDLDTLATMYLIREYGNDIDAGMSSMYFTKPAGSDKLFASPIWDMDRAFGDSLPRYEVDYGDPGIWWANSLGYYAGANALPTVFNAAYRHRDFRAAVWEKWEDARGQGFVQALVGFVRDGQQALDASRYMNAVRWNLYDTDEQDVLESRYAQFCDKLVGFLEARAASLDKGFCDGAVMLYYDANGGTGAVYNRRIMSKGETATVARSKQNETKILDPDNQKVFSHWNTMPDGSGQDYAPGDEIVVDHETTLYAIWREAPVFHATVTGVMENGTVLLDLTAQQLADQGCLPGDLTLVRAGSYEGAAAYYTGNYAEVGEVALFPDAEGNGLALFWKDGSISENCGIFAGDEVVVQMAQKDGMWEREAAKTLFMSEDRSDYLSDEQYGNFRSIELGQIAPGVLYRSSDPTILGARGNVIDRLLEAHGIRTVLDMAYTDEELAGRIASEAFQSPYYASLFADGTVFAEKMPYNYRDEAFSEALKEGLTFLAENDPPYLIHCIGGKDRTGFVAMLLEMLMGATRDEIIEDYMATYVNLYGLTRYTGPYLTVQSQSVEKTLRDFMDEYGVDDRLRKSARDYLTDVIGLDPDTLEQLMQKLGNR